jgi:hypothetical protein
MMTGLVTGRANRQPNVIYMYMSHEKVMCRALNIIILTLTDRTVELHGRAQNG